MAFQERPLQGIDGGRVLTRRGEAYVVFQISPEDSSPNDPAADFSSILDSVATANNARNPHGVGQVSVTSIAGENGQVWAGYRLVAEGVGKRSEVVHLQGDQTAVANVITGAEKAVRDMRAKSPLPRRQLVGPH